MKRTIDVLGAVLIVCGLAASAAAGEIRRVPSQYPTIQAGIDAALPGDIVLVADGVYRGPGNREIQFGPKAITVRSERGPQNCIIDCEATKEQPRRAFYLIGVPAEASLEGFTMINGVGVWNTPVFDAGGALVCLDGARLTIRDCVMVHNRSYE